MGVFLSTHATTSFGVQNQLYVARSFGVRFSAIQGEKMGTKPQLVAGLINVC